MAEYFVRVRYKTAYSFNGDTINDWKQQETSISVTISYNFLDITLSTIELEARKQIMKSTQRINFVVKDVEIISMCKI